MSTMNTRVRFRFELIDRPLPPTLCIMVRIMSRVRRRDPETVVPFGPLRVQGNAALGVLHRLYPRTRVGATVRIRYAY